MCEFSIKTAVWKRCDGDGIPGSDSSQVFFLLAGISTVQVLKFQVRP